MTLYAKLSLPTTTLVALLGLPALFASHLAQSATAWPSLPSTPIAVMAQADPNILLTLDDSGSMTWAFVPDNPTVTIDGTTYNNTCPSNWGVGTGGADWNSFTCKRVLAAGFNPLAYNPFVVYDPPYNPNLTGAKLSSTFTNAPINGFNPGGVKVNLSTNYQPMMTYSPAYNSITPASNRLAYLRFSPVETAYYYAFFGDLGPSNTVPAPGTDPDTFVRNTVAPNATCAGVDVAVQRFRDECYVKVAVSSAHQQNFANWYSFYRNRNLLTASAANIAFYDLNPDYRLSFQSLSTSWCGSGFNRTDCKGWDSVNRQNYLRPLSNTTHRSAFYNWMSRLPASGSTPLRTALQRAGEFYKSTGVNSPRAFDPGTSENPISTCRANFSVLMTDGIWNTGSESGFISRGNADGSGMTFPDGTDYKPAPPYQDANSNSLADLAFYYWATDLQPTVANDMIPWYVPSSTDYWDAKNDPATWQHMVTFTIGLGLGGSLNGLTAGDGSGYLPNWGTNMWDGDYPLLKAGPTMGGKAWPLTGSDRQGNVADLWHAAVNSRGMFFNADSPQSIQRAFKTILNRVKNTETSLGQIGSSTTRVSSDTVSVDSKFVPKEWYSTLTAYKVNEDGTRSSAIWTSDTTFTNETGRNIFTYVNGSGTAFDSSFFSLYGSSKLGTSDVKVFDWLRGQRTYEETVSGSITLRKRTQLLGDIVGSDVLVSGRDDDGYRFIGNAGATDYTAARDSYAAYVSSKKPVVFAAANDGMLHAFDGLTGREIFAYIPSAVLLRLRNLAQDDYVHEYFVDGTLTLRDFYVGSSWKTILVGALGGGGRGWFGLDVTSVVTGGGFSASNVFFDLKFDSGDPNLKELGFSLTTPVVGRTITGEWIVLMANGYGDNTAPYTGNSCKAQLLIYSLNSRSLSRLDTGVGACAVGQYNGLSSPAGLEFAPGSIVGAYAGDYQGNLWRFMLDPTTGLWKAPELFFVAKDPGSKRQPITAAPTLRKHPGGGVMVVVGTGKFFESNDRSEKSLQTIYGLRDIGQAISGRSMLVQQTFAGASSKDMNEPYRILTNNDVDWVTKRGWYFDMDSTLSGGPSGERVVAAAALNFDLALFNTYAPGANACTGAGAGYLMTFNAFTGGIVPNLPLFDTNNDGKIDAVDLLGGNAQSGVKLAGQSLKSPTTMLVTTATRGAAAPGVGGCGGLGAAPCAAPTPPCVMGLTVVGGICQELKCPAGYIQVSSGGLPRCMVSESSRYPRWIELN